MKHCSMVNTPDNKTYLYGGIPMSNFFINDFQVFDGRFSCCLPMNMEPSQKAFEDYGFEFHDNDDKLVWAVFPKGWFISTYFGQDTLFIHICNESEEEIAGFELTTDDMIDQVVPTLKLY